ncbi:hypothetical protein D3C85_1879500 [compost metagenome]
MALAVDDPAKHPRHAVHVQLARQVKPKKAAFALEVLQAQRLVFARFPLLKVEKAGFRRYPQV